MVPLLPLRDGVRALPISFFRQSMPSFYMNAPDCICSPGRLPLGAFCTGRDGRYGQDWPTRCAFQSTHPVRGATQGVLINLAEKNISIHAPRAGCDVGSGNIWLATNTISIHSPRAGCDASQIGVEPQIEEISIHAPRAGCDLYAVQLPWQSSISIHAPRAGCDFYE